MPFETFTSYWPFDFLFVCWVALAAVFLARKINSSSTEVRRDRRAGFAIAIQGVAFGLVWSFRRHLGVPLISAAAQPYLDIFACALAAATVAWVLVSVRTLGKQWTVAARLVQDHQLITSGPYALVRNPIYSGLFAMMLATGIMMTRWQVLLIAIVLYLAATRWRIRIEENLLRGQFGAAFDDYCRKVPSALLPGL